MNASHNGLRDDYEVSCKELDLLTDIARSITGVVGSRMTGAGFGGCTVSIVHKDALETFQTRVRKEYHEQIGIEPEIYLCHVGDGAQVFWLFLNIRFLLRFFLLRSENQIGFLMKKNQKRKP